MRYPSLGPHRREGELRGTLDERSSSRGDGWEGFLGSGDDVSARGAGELEGEEICGDVCGVVGEEWMSDIVWKGGSQGESELVP